MLIEVVGLTFLNKKYCCLQDCIVLARKRVKELQQILSEAISDMEVD